MLCSNAEETMDHLFMSCPFAKGIWANILLIFGLENRHKGNLVESIVQWNWAAFKNPIITRAWIMVIGVVF